MSNVTPTVGEESEASLRDFSTPVEMTVRHGCIGVSSQCNHDSLLTKSLGLVLLSNLPLQEL